VGIFFFHYYLEENMFPCFFCNSGQERQEGKNHSFEYWSDHFSSFMFHYLPVLEKEAEAINSNSNTYW